MNSLLLATRNRGKKREIENLLNSLGTGIRFLSLDDVGVAQEADETGATFAANARLKADLFSRLAGLDTLGDDSGLEVLALDGRPGVLSARYAGEGAGDEARIVKLLAALKEVNDRRARFVSAVCISRNGAPLAQFTGTVEGEILRAKRGDNGFGYDPVFFYPPLGKTFAELTLNEKNTISHRARALEQVREFILSGELT